VVGLSKYDIEVDLEHRQGTSHALLVELVGANKRVLDVGCDTGYLGEALNTLGNETIGFESNAAAAEAARTKLSRVEVGDLETTDLVALFGRSSFDVVVFGDVLEHLRDPLPVLRQGRPLLAPGGSVVISTPNVAHGDVRLALLDGRFRYTKVGILDDTHTRFFTRDSLVDFLRDAGFVLADLRRTRAELFSTEVGVVEGDYDPQLVARLREDDEATTYQFVVRAVPDDSASVESEQALRLDEAQRDLAVERRRTAELTAAGAALTSEIETLRARLDEVQHAHDEAVHQRDLAMGTVERKSGGVAALAAQLDVPPPPSRLRRLKDRLLR
jgi:2-polyprenyl-3-methyl-5-hydroxy-6-metoxy-1,4-benzoquinol methylase